MDCRRPRVAEQLGSAWRESVRTTDRRFGFAVWSSSTEAPYIAISTMPERLLELCQSVPDVACATSVTTTASGYAHVRRLLDETQGE